MTDEQLKAAGYTHYITYQVWLPIAGTWSSTTGFPTTSDALQLHLASLKKRLSLHEIRDLRWIAL